MKFIVMKWDDESDHPIAMYEDRTLAEKHSEWVHGWIAELSVSTELPSEVGDPVEVERRAVEAAESRALYERQQADRRKRGQQRGQGYGVTTRKPA